MNKLRPFSVLAVLIFALLFVAGVLPTFAQVDFTTNTPDASVLTNPVGDVTTVTGDVPAADVTAEATADNPIINVTINNPNPANTSATGTTATTPIPAEWLTFLPLIERAGYWLIIILLAVLLINAYSKLHQNSIQFKDMMSLDTLRGLLSDARRLSDQVTEVIPGKLDEAFVEVLFNRLKGWAESLYKPNPTATPPDAPAPAQAKSAVLHNDASGLPGAAPQSPVG